MKPYFEAPGPPRARLFLGDCREILFDPTLAADLILTDPPYGIGYKTGWRNDGDPRAIQGDDDLAALREAWPMAMNRLRENRHWYCFASPRRIPETEAVTGKPKHIIAWDKGNQGTSGDLKGGFGEAWEAVFFGHKGRRELFGPRPRTIIRLNWSSNNDPVHPCVKPVELLRLFITLSTQPGETILDPFAGSGTALLAAALDGRDSIGIELSEQYAEIAAKRLEGRLAGEPLPFQQ